MALAHLYLVMIKYMEMIRLGTLSNFYWLNIHNEICVALANIQWNINLFIFLNGHKKSWFSLIEYVDPPKSLFKVGYLNEIRRCSPISFTYVSI